MDRPGEKLKRVRERLQLTYRDVEQASQVVAERRGSDEFAIALSRLADIENKGTMPSIFRLYTLCAVYRLDLNEVLRWYGVPPEMLAADAFQLCHPATHTVEFRPTAGEAAEPAGDVAESRQTVFLGHPGRNFQKIPLHFLADQEGRPLRYGMIGLEDWSMHPILPPGSLVTIDDSRRKIASSGWSDERERPIYFLEHRGGHACGWCAVTEGKLVLQPHPASEEPPRVFAYPSEVDVLGQVIGVAMRLAPGPPKRTRPGAVPGASPGL